MPEGDTVHLAAARLAATLEGRTLAKTEFRVPQHATADLSGKRVERVTARGKHLLFRIEGGVTLHTHFKMEGVWHLYRPGERWRVPGRAVRVVLQTEETTAVGADLAVVDLVRTDEEHTVVGHLGPDPLGEDWDADEAQARLEKHPDVAIGEALLDQTVMAGPGNIYRCEICFLRGTHPDVPVRDAGDLRALVDLTKRLMEANRATGMQITTGDRRRGHERWVYGRRALPCRRCGTPIAKRTERRDGAARPTYWCPSCQPDPVR